MWTQKKKVELGSDASFGQDFVNAYVGTPCGVHGNGFEFNYVIFITSLSCILVGVKFYRT